ncbi:hypothetical protein RFI_29203, partial [Reticulomyxa filosa]
YSFILMALKDKSCLKEEKRERLRLQSVTELVETEKSYVADLETLTTVYIGPLSKHDIITQEEHNLLFKEIPALAKLNQSFCDSYKTFLFCSLSEIRFLSKVKYNERTALMGRFGNWDPALSKIGDHFLKYTPFFNMYQGYANFK